MVRVPAMTQKIIIIIIIAHVVSEIHATAFE